MFNEHVRRAVIRREAVGVSFGFYSADEILRLSVLEVLFMPLLVTNCEGKQSDIV